MTKLHIERVGGLAGFGLPGSRLRSLGEIEFKALSQEDQAAVEKLFKTRNKPAESATRDGFRYRLTCGGSQGGGMIEVGEEHLPASVIGCVRDELI